MVCRNKYVNLRIQNGCNSFHNETLFIFVLSMLFCFYRVSCGKISSILFGSTERISYICTQKGILISIIILSTTYFLPKTRNVLIFNQFRLIRGM